MNKYKPVVGNIYMNEYGDALLLCRADDNYYHFMYDDGSFDDIYDIPSDFTYIGHYDVNKIFNTMEDAKNSYMDIDKQALHAIQYINNHVYDKDGNTRLVGSDMRVDHDINTVFVQVYSMIGAGYQWVSVADICKDFTLKSE